MPVCRASAAQAGSTGTSDRHRSATAHLEGLGGLLFWGRSQLVLLQCFCPLQQHRKDTTCSQVLLSSPARLPTTAAPAGRRAAQVAPCFRICTSTPFPASTSSNSSTLCRMRRVAWAKAPCSFAACSSPTAGPAGAGTSSSVELNEPVSFPMSLNATLLSRTSHRGGVVVARRLLRSVWGLVSRQSAAYTRRRSHTSRNGRTTLNANLPPVSARWAPERGSGRGYH
jgi:hypothetical protein